MASDDYMQRTTKAIRGAGKFAARAQGPGQLATMRRLMRAVAESTAVAVSAWREQGASWEQIGNGLGLGAEVAEKLFGGRAEEQRNGLRLDGRFVTAAFEALGFGDDEHGASGG